jgi:cytochrome c peroxidase
VLQQPPRQMTRRNSGSLVNVAHYRWWPWDGRSDSLWMQCAVAYEAGATMAGTPERMAEQLASRYTAQLAGAGFGLIPGRERDSAVIAYKALAAYLSLRLNSANAPFDRFAEGDETALNDEQKKGLKLFLGKAGCIECHSGPAFNGVASARSEGDFYMNTGVASRGTGVPPDLGRADGLRFLTGATGSVAIYNSAGPYNDAADAGFNRTRTVSARPEDVGAFRIKSLRQVAETGPYMHAGQLESLADVVHFYNVGGDPEGFPGAKDRRIQPLGLTEEEEHQLVAFLGSLTGAPPESGCPNYVPHKGCP